MSLFGAPLTHEDHAERGVRTAWEIRQRLAGAELHAPGGDGGDEPLRVRMGLNSGPVIVGRIGDSLRMDYTAVGDTTNTAARLEGMTKGKPYSLLLASSTRELLTDASGLERVGEVEVRGRQSKLEVWTLAPGATERGSSPAPAASRS